MIDFEALTTGVDGLVVSVVQDAATDAVLMVGYMTREALDLTQKTGLVHFWSRSRQAIWQKGETSGNTLTLVAMATDCDSDALLITAVPAGPTCHTGSTTCFGEPVPTLGSAIDELIATISVRRSADPADSYTARLVADRNLAARKVLEEAGEVSFALKDLDTGHSPTRVTEESADLIYHLLVLMASADVPPADVAQELRGRRA